MFSAMNRRLRPTKSTQQIKEEPINFLLEEVEKDLKECKNATEIKNSAGSLKSNDSVFRENKELKKYIENINQRY